MIEPHIWKIYLSNWIISPGRGENKKSLKPPPWYSRYWLKQPNCLQTIMSQKSVPIFPKKLWTAQPPKIEQLIFCPWHLHQPTNLSFPCFSCQTWSGYERYVLWWHTNTKPSMAVWRLDKDANSQLNKHDPIRIRYGRSSLTILVQDVVTLNFFKVCCIMMCFGEMFVSSVESRSIPSGFCFYLHPPKPHKPSQGVWSEDGTTHYFVCSWIG